MISAKRVHDLINEHTGIASTRVRDVSRRLREAGILPAGASFVEPRFSRADAVTLLVGCANGATLATVADATRAYLATTPGGADVSGAPLSIPRTAEIQLSVLAKMATDGDSLDGLIIEIVHGWPEISLQWADGVIQRFQEAGALSGHQPSHKSRIATIIPGPAFAAFIRSLV